MTFVEIVLALQSRGTLFCCMGIVQGVKLDHGAFVYEKKNHEFQQQILLTRLFVMNIFLSLVNSQSSKRTVMPSPFRMQPHS